MFERVEVVFPHKAVLTSAMLGVLRNYPDDYFRLSLKNHSDGIIAGLEYEQADDDLHLASGIMKWQGEIYFLREKINISKLMASASSGKTYYLYLAASEDKSRQECINYKQLQIRVSDNKEDCLSLGRVFIHGKGKLTLPELDLNAPDQFGQFVSDSKFNLLDVYYSALGGPTFHPYIFTAIKQFLRQKKQKTMMDYAILVHLQSSPVLDTETMRSYIAEASGKDMDSDHKDNTNEKPGSRRELFEEFAHWLKESRQEIFVSMGKTENNASRAESRSKNTGRMI